MTDLVIVVPSRGRPERARELAAAVDASCTANTQLVFALDDNDETAQDYLGWKVLLPSRSMGEALHLAATDAATDAFAVAFMGDDHMPRTVGWDEAYLDALRELGTGIVYGDDLLQGRALPTQCAMTSDIIRALGYMAPTSLVHLYFDNYWLSLGNEAGCIRYLPDVIVEHRHPVAGKAALDEGYERVNSVAMQARDAAAFNTHIDSGAFARDVEKVKALRGDAFIEKYARPGLVSRG